MWLPLTKACDENQLLLLFAVPCDGVECPAPPAAAAGTGLLVKAQGPVCPCALLWVILQLCWPQGLPEAVQHAFTLMSVCPAVLLLIMGFTQQHTSQLATAAPDSCRCRTARVLALQAIRHSLCCQHGRPKLSNVLLREALGLVLKQALLCKQASSSSRSTPAAAAMGPLLLWQIATYHVQAQANTIEVSCSC